MSAQNTSPQDDHARATPQDLPKEKIKPLPAVPVWVILLISVPISLLVLIPVLIHWLMSPK